MHRVQIDAACWYTRSVACVSVCCMQPWAVLKRLNRSRRRLGVDSAGNNESRCRKRDNFEGTFCLHTTQSSQIVPNNWQSSERIQSRFNCNIIQCNRNRNAHRVNSIYSTSVAHVHKISWLYYQSVCHAAYYIIRLINASELCALSTSVWDCLMSTWLDVFSERLQCSRVSEPVTSLSDVASTDTESWDTATESADWYRHCHSSPYTEDWQSVSVQSVRQCHHPATEQTPAMSQSWVCEQHTTAYACSV